MVDGPDEVENRYRTALGRGLPDARGHANRIAYAFRKARVAMEAEAWVSPLGDAFASALSDAQAGAGNAAGECVEALEARHRREPSTVPRSDNRAYGW